MAGGARRREKKENELDSDGATESKEEMLEKLIFVACFDRADTRTAR